MNGELCRCLNVVQLVDVTEDMLTELQSTLEDDVSDTRLLSCRLLGQLLSRVGRHVDRDRLHQLYPCLLKRLDDSTDDVRVAASHTFSAYMHCFHDDYDVVMYRAHIDAIYQGLLVHLDDQDSVIQQSILGNGFIQSVHYTYIRCWSPQGHVLGLEAPGGLSFVSLALEVKSLALEVLGLRSQVLGLGSQVLGLRSQVLGLRSQVLGLESQDLGLESQVLGLGSPWPWP